MGLACCWAEVEGLFCVVAGCDLGVLGLVLAGREEKRMAVSRRCGGMTILGRPLASRSALKNCENTSNFPWLKMFAAAQQACTLAVVLWRLAASCGCWVVEGVGSSAVGCVACA